MEYQVQLEELKSQVMISLYHLPESYYISIFTSGLKEIKSMVKIIQSPTLIMAFEIASLQENTITPQTKDLRPSNHSHLLNGAIQTLHQMKPHLNPHPIQNQISKTPINPFKFKAITPRISKPKGSLDLINLQLGTF